MNVTSQAQQYSRSLEESAKKYLNKLEKTISFDIERKELYQKLVMIIHNYNNEHKYQVEGMEISKETCTISPTRNVKEVEEVSTVCLGIDNQKAITQRALNKLYELLKHNLDFHSYGCFSIEFMCEFIILKMMIKIIDNKDFSTKFYDYLLQTIENLIVNKCWKTPLELKKSYNQICNQLNIKKDPTEQIIILVALLGQQSDCLNSPLEEYGFHKPNEPEKLAQILKDFFLLQEKLIKVIQPQLSGSLIAQKEESIQAALAYLFRNQHHRSIFSTIPMRKKAYGRLKLLKRDTSLQIPTSICQEILTSEDPSQFFHQSKSYTSHVFTQQNHYLLANRGVSHLLEKGQRNLELLLPLNKRHPKAELKFRARIALIGAVYLDLSKSIRKEIKAFYEKTDEQYPPPSSDLKTFCQFLHQWCQLQPAYKALKPETQNDNDPQAHLSLLSRFAHDKEEWYKDFLFTLTDNISNILERSLDHLRIVYQDWHDQQGLIARNFNIQEFYLFFAADSFLNHMITTTTGVKLTSRKDFFYRIYKLMKDHDRERLVFFSSRHFYNKELIEFNKVNKFYNEREKDKELKSLDIITINQSLNELKKFKGHMDLGIGFFLPSIKMIQDEMEAHYKKELESWQSIDTHFFAKRRPKIPRVNKEQFTPPNAYYSKTVKKNEEVLEESESKKKTAIETSFPFQTQNLFYLNNHSSNDQTFYPPHQIRYNKGIDEWEIFFQDYAYHYNHAIWTFEMIVEALKRGKPSFIPFLGSSLVNYLYLSEEQLVTPLYLDTIEFSQLHHGLFSMNGALGRNPSANNDKGGYWNRYPHSSKAYYEKIPLGLQLILNLNSEKEMLDGLLLLLEEGYESISSLLTESMNPCHWKNHFDEMEHKIKGLIVTAKELASLPTISSDKVREKREFDSFFQEKSNAFGLMIQRLSQGEQDLNDHPAYQDLMSHIIRLRGSLHLLQEFPEQRFWSFHERSIKVGSQLFCEIACALLTQLWQGREIHTHYLEEYVDCLGLQKKLSGLSLKTLFSLNMEKGSDYIYWKFFKNKHNPHPKCLKDLSLAYEISLTGAVFEEGFLPASLKNITLEKKRRELLKFIEADIQLMNELVDLLLG